MLRLNGGDGLSLVVPSPSRLLRLGSLDGSCPDFEDPCRSLGPAGCQRSVSPVGWMPTPRICGKAVVETKPPWEPGDGCVSDELCLGPQPLMD